MTTSDAKERGWLLEEQFAENHLLAVRRRDNDLKLFAQILMDLPLRAYEVAGSNRIEDTFIHAYVRPYLFHLFSKDERLEHQW